MLVIFGFGHMTKKENELPGQVVCPNCRNAVRMQLTKQTTWVSLFFIPVIPYKTEYRKICPVCRQGIQLHYDEYMNSIKSTH